MSGSSDSWWHFLNPTRSLQFGCHGRRKNFETKKNDGSFSKKQTNHSQRNHYSRVHDIDTNGSVGGEIPLLNTLNSHWIQDRGFEGRRFPWRLVLPLLLMRNRIKTQRQKVQRKKRRWHTWFVTNEVSLRLNTAPWKLSSPSNTGERKVSRKRVMGTKTVNSFWKENSQDGISCVLCLGCLSHQRMEEEICASLWHGTNLMKRETDNKASASTDLKSLLLFMSQRYFLFFCEWMSNESHKILSPQNSASVASLSKEVLKKTKFPVRVSFSSLSDAFSLLVCDTSMIQIHRSWEWKVFCSYLSCPFSCCIEGTILVQHNTLSFETNHYWEEITKMMTTTFFRLCSSSEFVPNSDWSPSSVNLLFNWRYCWL
jgi:hypothetical protein